MVNLPPALLRLIGSYLQVDDIMILNRSSSKYWQIFGASELGDKFLKQVIYVSLDLTANQYSLTIE